MSYLAKVARADAIAVILNMKGEGYVTYVAHNLPTETKWSEGLPSVMLAKVMSERATDQATSGVTLMLSDGRAADTLAVSPVIWKDQVVGGLAAATLNVVVPRGADVVLVAAKVQQGGKMKGSDLIELKVNGKVRQTSDLSKMIWNVQETIAYLSGLVKLAPGDLIYTGTPENVAAVERGDVLQGTVEGVGTVTTRIV